MNLSFSLISLIFFLNLFVGGQWWRADVKEQGNEWDQYI